MNAALCTSSLWHYKPCIASKCAALPLQVVSLVAKILPLVPNEAASRPAVAAAAAAQQGGAGAAQQQGAKDAAAERQSAEDQRVRFLQQNAALLEKFSRELLPSLLHVRYLSFLSGLVDVS